MIRNSEAYVVLRKHSQQMMDFAVLVCTAAPQLKRAFHEHAAAPGAFLATNSTFPASKDPYSTEKRALNGYTTVLGANLLLSIFSYFETYFFSAFDEIVEFHGGQKSIEAAIAKQLADRPLPPEVGSALKGLRTTFKPNRADQYRNLSSKVRGTRVTWPSQRFMLYGLKQALAQRKRWKSVDIPDLAKDLYGVPVTEEERTRFHSIRDERNKIAHGRNLSYDLRKAVDAGYFLRNFAAKLDAHLMTNFFLVERYVH